MYQVQSQGEVGNCSKEVQNASRRDRRIWIGKQMHRLNSASCLKCLLKAMDRFIFPPWSAGFLEWISSVCLLASTQSSFLKSVCKKSLLYRMLGQKRTSLQINKSTVRLCVPMNAGSHDTEELLLVWHCQSLPVRDSRDLQISVEVWGKPNFSISSRVLQFRLTRRTGICF